MKTRWSFVSLLLAAPALLVTGALAQEGAPAVFPPAQPVPGVKHAGTYNLATGTWMRGSSSLTRGTHDVLYDNTCSSSFYLSIGQQRIVDDGRIPSIYSPQIDQPPMSSGLYEMTSLVGTSDAYQVNWFSLAYCTGAVGPLDVETNFWTCYSGCQDDTVLTPTASFQISGLPGSPTAGSLGCWLVSIDLAGSTLGFAMGGDCDGSWDGDPAQDNFGYSWAMLTPDPSGLSGPFLAGDPLGAYSAGPGSTGCCVGCNTVFWAGTGVPGTAGEGSGLSDSEVFVLDDQVSPGTFVYNGCFWFGCQYPTCPRADVYMEIQGEAINPLSDPGTQYCCANAGACNLCPCNNQNDNSTGCAGCANGTFTSGARLWATGKASVTNDTLVLRGERGQPGNAGMFFQGISNLDCAGIFLADGVRCAGGAVKRIQVRFSGPGGNARTTTSIYARSALMGDVITPGSTRYYQWWYRDTNNPACGSGVNDSNTSNGYSVLWTL